MLSTVETSPREKIGSTKPAACERRAKRSPSDLVDEAFLRRIHYPVFAESPTEDDFRQIFKMVCEERDLGFDPALPDHLLRVEFPARGVQMRGCHPRDLIDQALSLAQYREEPRRLTTTLLGAACDGYFVDDDQELSPRQ